VACEEIRVQDTGDELSVLRDLVAKLKDEPTLIFCRSPKRVNEVVRALLDIRLGAPSKGLEDAVRWLRSNFHPDWILPKALENGFGLHHGRLPRSISQFVLRAFNTGQITVLACTSTLIEGVNTKAKNVIIFDNVIAKEKFDFFTFNNIKGRSGRMFHHFVGRVFLFHEPPSESLPFVDFPVFTQKPETPESILVQMDQNDLTADARARLEPLMQQAELPLDLIKKHGSIEPHDLIDLAKRLKRASNTERQSLAWTRTPSGQGLRLVCELAWTHLIKRGHAGVLSSKQLARNVWELNFKKDIRDRIQAELTPGPYAAPNADEAIERILEFDRTWASFELPRLLRAFSDLRKHVLGGSGDYSFFASQIENLFREPFQVTLEEFGLPLQITDKIARFLHGTRSIDEALARIRSLEPTQLGLNAFEVELLKDSQQTI
jgi:hypothetical protein